MRPKICLDRNDISCFVRDSFVVGAGSGIFLTIPMPSLGIVSD